MTLNLTGALVAFMICLICLFIGYYGFENFTWGKNKSGFPKPTRIKNPTKINRFFIFAGFGFMLIGCVYLYYDSPISKNPPTATSPIITPLTITSSVVASSTLTLTPSAITPLVVATSTPMPPTITPSVVAISTLTPSVISPTPTFIPEIPSISCFHSPPWRSDEVSVINNCLFVDRTGISIIDRGWKFKIQPKDVGLRVAFGLPLRREIKSISFTLNITDMQGSSTVRSLFTFGVASYSNDLQSKGHYLVFDQPARSNSYSKNSVSYVYYYSNVPSFSGSGQNLKEYPKMLPGKIEFQFESGNFDIYINGQKYNTSSLSWYEISDSYFIMHFDIPANNGILEGTISDFDVKFR